MKLTIRTETGAHEVELNEQLTNVDVLLNVTEAKLNEETNELETDEATASWITEQIADQNEAFEKLSKLSDDPMSDWNEAIRDVHDYEDIPSLINDFIASKYKYRLVSVYNQGDEDWKDFSDLDEALEAMAIADQYISDLERKQGNKVYVGLVDGDDYTEVWTMADKFRRDVTRQVGQNIKEARSEAGLSQKQLADKIGTAQRQITRYETGEQDLTLTRLREIEIALNMEAGSLLKNT